MQNIETIELEKEINENILNGITTTQFFFQKEEWDCGLCCLSYITKIPYDIIKKDYFAEFKLKNIVNSTQLGCSYKNLCQLLIAKYNQNIKLIKQIGSSLLDLPIENNKKYLCIFYIQGYSHFVYIEDKIVFDSENGVFFFDDVKSIKEYIKITKFTHWKYLTGIL